MLDFCIVLWILALIFWAFQSEACFSTAKYRLSESYDEIIFTFIFISVCVSQVWHWWSGELREAGQVAAEALSQHVRSCFTIVKIITVCAHLLQLVQQYFTGLYYISVCVSAVWHRWTGELREAGQVAAEALSQHVQWRSQLGLHGAGREQPACWNGKEGKEKAPRLSLVTCIL